MHLDYAIELHITLELIKESYGKKIENNDSNVVRGPNSFVDLLITPGRIREL